MFPNLRDIVETAIRNHPKDCIFGPDPVSGAVKHFAAQYDASRSSEETLTAIVEAIQSQEIYCPHEGIDRR